MPVRTGWAFVLAACAPVMAQRGSEIPCAIHGENSARMEVTLALDRTEYMPDEIMVISVTVRNGTGQALEVFDPLAPSGMFLEFVGGALMHPRRQSGCWARTTVLQPGQVVQRQFRSDQLAGWQPQSSNVRALAGTPDPGDYLLVAEYGDGQFETSFRVVHFDLEAHTKLKLQEPKVVQLDDGRTATYERSVEGFVLARGGKRYVAVQASWNSRPAIRVAELEPDESLDGLEEGRDGRITARIRSGSGRVRLADRPEPDQMPQ